MDLQRSGKDTAKCAWSSSWICPQPPPLVQGPTKCPDVPCSRCHEQEAEWDTQEQGVEVKEGVTCANIL